VRGKSENPRFEICVSGAIWRRREKFEQDAQLQIIQYKKPQNILNIARLNSISVSTNGGTIPCDFGTTCTNLIVFMTSRFGQSYWLSRTDSTTCALS